MVTDAQKERDESEYDRIYDEHDPEAREYIRKERQEFYKYQDMSDSSDSLS